MTDPGLLERLAAVDPAPLFVISLFPYLAFLGFAAKVKGFPRLGLRGFQATLLFVVITIVASVIALKVYGRQLADVDVLHGSAEAFLTLANLLVVVGFSRAVQGMNKS